MNVTKLLTGNELHVKVLKGIICLVLLAVTKTDSAGCSDEKSLCRNPAFFAIQDCVRNWIQNTNVVGGKRFGGAYGQIDTEIQVSIVELVVNEGL